MSRIQTQFQALIDSTKNTFQNSSQQIDLANSDVLHIPERRSETERTPVNHPDISQLVDSLEDCKTDKSQLVASQKLCETDFPEEKSVIVISQEGNKDDGSRNSLLARMDAVGRFAGDSNQGPCTYPKFAPDVVKVKTEEAVQQEECQVFDRIQTVSERSSEELQSSVSAMFV